MKRKPSPQPDATETKYILGQFSVGKSVTEVQRATGSRFDVNTLDRLRLLALRGEAA